MCYDVRARTYDATKYINRYGRQFIDPTSPWFKLQHWHALAYDHPYIPVITSINPNVIDFLQWGLIPSWVKDPKQVVKIQNSTINARGEELEDKPSFKDAFRAGQRCLVILDAFYEHHHKAGSTFPYYIGLKNKEPISVAGLWSYWDSVPGHERATFTIITTSGNELISQIHNNPKLKGPRMPVIIPKDDEIQWLDNNIKLEEASELLKPFTSEQLEAYPVRKLRGKYAVGNNQLAIEPYQYTELTSEQGSLF